VQRDKEQLIEKIEEHELTLQKLSDEKLKLERSNEEFKKEQTYFRDSINQIK
jgi:hypothetical protein